MPLLGGFDPHRIGTPLLADLLGEGEVSKHLCEVLPLEIKEYFLRLLRDSTDLFYCFHDISYYAPQMSSAFAVAGLDYVHTIREKDKGREISAHWKEILTLARQNPKYQRLHREGLGERGDRYPQDLSVLSSPDLSLPSRDYGCMSRRHRNSRIED